MNENVKDTDITIDPDEIKRFSSLAKAWWDPEGDFATVPEDHEGPCGQNQ